MSTIKSDRTLATIAGAAWLAAAVAMGYLALLQLGYAGTFVDDGSLTALSAWNGLAAAITGYFGLRLLTAPSRSTFGRSMIWSVVNVVGGVWQISQGASHEAYLLSVVLAGVAGVASLAGSRAWPDEPR